MERFSSRDNVLLGYMPQKSHGSPKTPSKSLDVDFNDVFGGPPRRSSVHDWRSSEEETVYSRDPWSGLSEKPVFGEEIAIRKKYPSDDFFGDIFRGDESSSPTPRKLSWDPFCPLPASRVSSPARSLPIQSESFRGSSLSLPPVLSLPVKLPKEMDSSAFPVQSRNPRKNKETALIGFSSSPGASTSRFSIQVFQGQEGLQNDSRTSYRQSSLSKEVSLDSEGSAQATKSLIQEGEDNCIEDSSSSEITYNSNQFHFSIYKWPSTVVPLVMSPLRKGIISRSKESSKSDNIVDGNGASDLLGVELPAGTYDMLPGKETFRELKENEDGNPLLSTESDLITSSEIVEEVISAKSESKPLTNLQNIFKKFQDNLLSQNSGKDVKTASGASIVDVGPFGSSLGKMMPISKKEVPKSEESLYCLLKEDKTGSGVCGADNRSSEGKQKRTPISKIELPKPEEPLYCLLKDITIDSCASGPNKDLFWDKRKPLSEKEAPKREESLYCSLQNDNSSQGNVKAVDKASRKKATVKSIHTSSGDVGKDKKKKTGMRNTLNVDEATSSRIQDAHVKLEDKPVNNNVKEKVQDFVNIFNQKAPSNSSRNVETRDQGATATDIGADRVEDQASVIPTKTDQKNARTLRDAPGMVYQSSKQFDKPQREIKTAAQIFDVALERNNSPTSCSETILENFNVEESCEDFTVKELSQDEKKQAQDGQNHDEIQASDSKIRKWSNGKEGNIRSLLSTLQYVLWAESGWKPVPLVDIIEGSSVRRAYQKALLCLHPDKLQQKGAAPHHKYIAEKVFDILQDSWAHFNSLGSVL